MHSIVIRGGTIIDGTGRAAYVGDVAIDEDRIASVGGKAGPGEREIDAEGLIVTPGWIDVHTHYDAQAIWDPIMAPSSWHGVTTVMAGNCGVGFAPVRNSDRQAVIDLMEGVEEIPGVTLTEGLNWDWESFPDYLDRLEQTPRTINFAAQMTHHPLRVYVMGERAIRHEAATPEDIAEMRRLTLEGLKAGAFGFTTSRSDAHKTLAGVIAPARNAEAIELKSIASALGEVGRGAFGLNTEFDSEDDEFAWITEVARDIGRPVWFLMGQRSSDPQRHHRLTARIHEARGQGLQISAQVPGRPVGVMMGVDTALNPFTVRPSYEPLLALPVDERMARLRDPEVRRMILADQPSPERLKRLSPLRQSISKAWHRIFKLGNPPDYEPPPSASIAAIAEREGRTPDEVAYDIITSGLDQFLFFPILSYADGDHEAILEMMTDPYAILGLSDAGAHCSSIIDASAPTYMLTHWTRDRSRGARLPLEQVVRMQTGQQAELFGFKDRGVLAEGMMADINVIDFDSLKLHAPEIVYDLPAGGRRMVQRADGYVATLVAGQTVFENGVHSGALPGKLLRSGQ